MTDLDHPALSALSAALKDAANLLRVPVDGVALERMEAHEWPDSCLGLPEDDDACADVVTPGYLIHLSDGFTYHADQLGSIRRARKQAPQPDTEIRLRYSISGGITGGSTLYETDSYQLSDAEQDELRRLITEADFFNVANVLPESPVNDGMTMRLWIAVGRRSHEVIPGDGIDVDDSEAFHALVEWAAVRTPSRFPGLLDNLG